MKYRIGNAIDFHNLEPLIRTQITLGGILIESNYRIIALSDGDIIIHSICDAILGALCKGDIGEKFAFKTNEKKKSSLQILDYCIKLLNNSNMIIVNIDLTIICEHIYINKSKRKIVANLQKLLNCKFINLKATRWENKDDYRICCMCALLLDKKENV